MSTAEAERNAQRLFLGIFIATLGGFVSSFGLVMQKLAHKVNEGLPPEEKSKLRVLARTLGIGKLAGGGTR